MEERRGRRSETSPGEERGNETVKVVIILHGSVESTKRRQLSGFVDKPRESCTGATWNAACIVPRHRCVTWGPFGTRLEKLILSYFAFSTTMSEIGRRVNKVGFYRWQLVS